MARADPMTPPNDRYGILHSLVLHQPPANRLDGVFRTVGFVHLYSASGIHLQGLFGFVELLSRGLALRTRMEIRAIKAIEVLLIAAISLMVWRMEGFHPSLLRPIALYAIRKGFRFSGIHSPLWLPLFFVLAIELGITWALPPGAVHYYAAVFGSLLALDGRRGEGRTRLHLRMALYSWIPIAAFDLISDHLLAPWTPLFSLLTIPPVSLILYPITLFAFAFGGGFPDWLIQIWNSFFSIGITILDSVPLVFSIPPYGILTGAAFAILIRVLGFRRAILPIIPCLVASQILFSHPRVSRVRQWDVGQGDAALIQEGGRNEIIDAGPSRIMDASAWIRKLARAGAPRIDALMFSHLDEDHRGGSKMLLSVASVACVLLPLNVQRSDRGRRLASEILEEFPDTKIEEQDCIRLSRVGWFESKRSGSAGNELMAGVVHEMGGGRAYFALGDGDEIQELLYESYFRPELERNSERIWKVGHHGSRFSSNSGFLRRLQPKEAWISVGARNPYHHPAPATLGILRDLSIRFRRTDQEGDLELASTEKRIQGPSSSTFLKWLSK